MGFLNELKKLTRPYDDEEDEYQDFTPRSAERIQMVMNKCTTKQRFFLTKKEVID